MTSDVLGWTASDYLALEAWTDRVLFGEGGAGGRGGGADLYGVGERGGGVGDLGGGGGDRGGGGGGVDVAAAGVGGDLALSPPVAV